MTTPSQETQLALMAKQIEQLEAHQEQQDDRLKGMEDERNKALKWGISALGGMLVAVATWGLSFLKDHLK
jgi:hypothetical protein